VAFLKRQPSLPPLSGDENLAAAALDHVAEQGASGEVGHQSRGGEPFNMRLRRHGVEARVEGENIAYGPAKAADVVRELIIDSGVADRGHRQNIFQPAFAAAGTTCGPHRTYGTVCVMDFSGPPPGAPATLARAQPSPGAKVTPADGQLRLALVHQPVEDQFVGFGCGEDIAAEGSIHLGDQEDDNP
jgi:Cysteine-rich secretory protein family